MTTPTVHRVIEVHPDASTETLYEGISQRKALKVRDQREKALARKGSIVVDKRGVGWRQDNRTGHQSKLVIASYPDPHW